MDLARVSYNPPQWRCVIGTPWVDRRVIGVAQDHGTMLDMARRYNRILNGGNND